MHILIARIGRSPAWVPPRTFVERLAAEFPAHDVTSADDYETLRKRLIDADVALTAVVDPDLFPSLTRLRWIQAPAVAVNHLLLPELIESPILVTSARGIRSRAIAEHVLGVVIALGRRLPVAIVGQSQRRWVQETIEQSGPVTLRNRRMGIVGLGSIGTAIAELMAALGMRVIGLRRCAAAPVPPFVDGVLPAEQLHELLAASDVVVVAAPLTPATRRLIGPAEIAVIKRGALLVNVSRGELLDDAAVIDGLRRGQLGGAALDVFTREPLPPTSPYWDLPNVIVTPHVAGSADDYWAPLADLFAENIRRFDSGHELLNVVDKRAGY